MNINLTIGPKNSEADKDVQDIQENDEDILVHWKVYPGGEHFFTDIQKDTLIQWYQQYCGGIVIPTPDPGNGGDDPGNDTPVDPSLSYAEYTGEAGIRFAITNNCGVEVRLSGAAILNVSKSPTDWANSTQVDADMHGPTVGSSWAYNDIIIPVGDTYISPTITSITGKYAPYLSTVFTDGTWYFMNNDNGEYMHSIFLYSRIYSKSRNEVSGSNHMYVVAPPQNTKLLNGYTYHLNLYWINPAASLDPDKSGTSYVILAENQTGLL